MPRHTHPAPVAKHSREHVRRARRRAIGRRLRTAQAMKLTGAPVDIVVDVSDWTWTRRLSMPDTRELAQRQLDELRAFAGQNGPIIRIERERRHLLSTDLQLLIARHPQTSGRFAHGSAITRLRAANWHCRCYFCVPEADRGWRRQQRSGWKRDRELLDALS
jgi:sugar phosphate isomerase/epimerase